MIVTNKYQSNITDELLSKLDPEHLEKFYDFVEKIPLLKRLVAVDRKYAKDKLKDDKGKIAVDLANPHILTDMEYFRPSVTYFKKYRKYTNFFPNKNPQSEYAKFWTEEKRRCLEGYVRESDGEWISGYNYFYWNYAPIMITVGTGEKSAEGKINSDRVEDFPNIWDSDYWYFHYIEQGEASGMYGKVLKTRGRGYSFKGASLDARNAIHIPKSKSFSMAFEKEYLYKDGIFNKAVDILDWNAKYTPFPRLRLKNADQQMHIIMGYTNKTLGVDAGMLSEIMGLSLKNDQDKARGKRCKLIKWEEDGKFPNLKQSWGIARMSLEDGRNVFGYMISFGTGGTEGADFEASKEFFYFPKGYNILGLENIYDVSPSGQCAFYVGEYLNRSHCYDKDGHSDVITALVEILEDRQKIKTESSDPNTIVQEIADRSITPQEAVMRREGSMFPTYELRQQLSELKTSSKLKNSSWKGFMTVVKGSVEHQVSSDIKIIDSFPHKEHTAGGIEIFAHPVSESDGKIPSFRYIAGCDPVDDDGSGTTSLLSTFVMNTLTGQIVAEYTGRPQITEDYFKQLRLLLLYYNAKVNYENNKKGLYGYFKNKNCLHLLAETPEILRDVMNVTMSKIGNKMYGTSATASVNTWHLGLSKKWLLADAYHQKEISEDKNEKENEENLLLNLHTLRSPALIEEYINWNKEGNFDRVSAMGMLLIYREEVQKLVETSHRRERNKITQDPFWFKAMGNQNPMLNYVKKDFFYKK